MKANGGSVLKPRAFGIDDVTRKMPHPLLKTDVAPFHLAIAKYSESITLLQLFGH